MMYAIINIRNGMALFQNFETLELSIIDRWHSPDDYMMFIANDLNEAKHLLNFTRSTWIDVDPDGWVIVDMNGDVVDEDIKEQHEE